MKAILITHKTEEIDTGKIACLGQVKVVIGNADQSAKDAVRRWKRFLDEQFDPKRFKNWVQWKPFDPTNE